MTHADTFTLDDGWAALRQMLAQIARRFGALGAAPLARDTYEELLQWLRPAEHLARLMLFVIARALAPVVRRARVWVKRATAARRLGFRFALRRARLARRVRRARLAGLYLWRRPRAPQDDDTGGWPAGVFEEVRPPPPRAPAPPAPAPAAVRLAMPAAPLAARLAALARVLADPHAAARRIARSVRTGDGNGDGNGDGADDGTKRLLDPRRIVTATPCAYALLHIHDRAFALTAPRAPDSS